MKQIIEKKNIYIYIYHIISYHIILYIIKVGLRRRGCAKWRHQIVEIFLDF